MRGTLYIVATPIGNMEDITLRALRVLREVDLILAEDTRVTKRLLMHYDIDTHTLSYHQHSSSRKKEEILAQLLSGKNIALVTDAGTPGISDPGNELIDYILENTSKILQPSFDKLRIVQNDDEVVEIATLGELACNDRNRREIDLLQTLRNNKNEIEISSPELNRDRNDGESEAVKIVPIPGVSAIAAALSVSGMNVNKFVFLGFLPKKKRKKLFTWLKEGGMAFAFYESPNRILKTLDVLEENFGSSTRIFVARELTKLYETLYKGMIAEVKEKLKQGRIKGEIVVVVRYGNKRLKE